MVCVLSDSAQVHAWSTLPEEEVYPGIFRQSISGARQTMVRYRYAPGSEFPLHSHPQEQVTLVVSGSITFAVGGAEVKLGAGQVAVIPGGVEHGARVDGSEWVETYNAMSPRRDVAPGPVRN